MLIRAEQETDLRAVRLVNNSAFDTPSEANLVDVLREEARPIVSLVAEDDGIVIGHVMFSPVSLSGPPEPRAMGLAPVAIMPDHQRKGVGSALIREGLEQCKRLGVAAVVVLGYPEYYPRFGFLPCSNFGIHSEFDVPKEVFMAIEIRPGAISGTNGMVKYHGVFNRI